jgi:octaprenyl-diphosphate synthase
LTTPSSELDRIIAFLRDDLEQVERVMRVGMSSVAPVIPAIGDHTFDSGGKRIRPASPARGAAVRLSRPRAIQIAVAAEYLHSASLLHDDVVDGAETRRGKPSVNARFGSKLAILVGDFLYARTCQTLVEDGDPDILASFAESIRAMAEGEVLQLTRSFDPELSESTYLDVIGGKTSSLLAAAAEAGAILGGVTRAERKAVRDYGWQLGLAFQLVDDALDYGGTARELGKAPFTDAKEGKLTLPLIATLKRCNTGERDSIVALLKSFALQGAVGREPDPAEVARVAECVQRHHGAETALARAQQLCANARAHRAVRRLRSEDRHARAGRLRGGAAELDEPNDSPRPFLTPNQERQAMKIRASIVRTTAAFALAALSRARRSPPVASPES